MTILIDPEIGLVWTVAIVDGLDDEDDDVGVDGHHDVSHAQRA